MAIITDATGQEIVQAIEDSVMSITDATGQNIVAALQNYNSTQLDGKQDKLPFELQIQNSTGTYGYIRNDNAKFVAFNDTNLIPAGWFSTATFDITRYTGINVFTTIDFAFTRDVQSINLGPGTYRLECWGAASRRGGNTSYGLEYFTGGYASGTMTIPEGSTYTFYVYVGGQPIQGIAEGGWNGGGGSNGAANEDDGMGGGATDICLVPSEMSVDHYRTIRSSASYLSRLIVAGGGGTGRGSVPASEVYGGSFNKYNTGTYCGKLNTQGNTYTDGTRICYPGGFGYGSSSYRGDSSDASGGSGAGWYGGGLISDNGGGGGSSYVWSDSLASYAPVGYSVPTELKMTNIQFKCGPDSVPSPLYAPGIANTTMTALYRDGYARITRIA